MVGIACDKGFQVCLLLVSPFVAVVVFLDPKRLPIIRIFSRSLKFRSYKGDVDYEGLLQFVLNRIQ